MSRDPFIPRGWNEGSGSQSVQQLCAGTVGGWVLVSPAWPQEGFWAPKPSDPHSADTCSPLFQAIELTAFKCSGNICLHPVLWFLLLLMLVPVAVCWEGCPEGSCLLLRLQESCCFQTALLGPVLARLGEICVP